MKRIALSILLGLGVAASAQAASYNIDTSHTQVLFTYNHLGFSNITGRFDQVSGKFDFDPAKPTSSNIQVEIPISSLSTGVAKLDQHLSTADYFDAEKFPTASFNSTKVTEAGKNKLQVAGDLTIHGVTKPVVLDVTINNIGVHPAKKVPAVGFDASTTIKRSDFGVANSVPFVSDAVTLRITMEAQQAKAETEAKAD